MATFAKDFLINKATIKLHSSNTERKVTIVGTGNVGMACAYAILNQKIANQICLIDLSESKVYGEIKDLQDAACVIGNTQITGGSDYSLSSNSQIIVITVGGQQKSGERRLQFFQRNAAIVTSVIPNVMEYNPNPILLVITNPCDIMTYLTWKLSGLPKNRVLGSGTTLDTCRFQIFLAERLGISPTECSGWILGEHGDTSVPIWSTLNVAGLRLHDVYPNMGKEDDPDDWNEVHKMVVDASYDIIEQKNYTNWGIGACCAMIVNDILNNTGKIRAISTSAQGHYGIEKNVFLSLPCVVTSDGVTNIVKLILSDDEIEDLQNSAKILYKNMCQLRT